MEVEWEDWAALGTRPAGVRFNCTVHERICSGKGENFIAWGMGYDESLGNYSQDGVEGDDSDRSQFVEIDCECKSSHIMACVLCDALVAVYTELDEPCVCLVRSGLAK